MSKNSEKTTIKIININPKIVAELNYFAKRKKISRSAYIRNILENHIYLSEYNAYKQQYQDLIDRCLIVINKNTEQLNRLNNIVQNSNDTIL